MKILKTLGYVLLGLIALTLIVGLIQPKHYEMERSLDIKASKEVVFAKINDLKTWESWSPFKDADPTMAITLGEKTEGVGASYSWTGKRPNNGYMEIVEADAPNSVKTAMKFDGSDGGTGWLKLADGENGATKTSWGWSMDVPYPFNAFMVFGASSMESTMNTMFDNGLAKLAKICEGETSAAKPSYSVYTADFPGKTYLGIKETVKGSEMKPDFFATRYGQIGEAMGKAKLEMDGMPCGLYFTWDESTTMTDMAVAMPVKGGKAQNSGKVEAIQVPASKAYVIDYYGPYEGTGDAHMAMDEYMKAKNLKAGSPVIEEYVTGPGSEPDPKKWLTKIYYLADAKIAEGHK